MGSFSAACLQMRSSRDPAVNLRTFEDTVREAASLGADYIQTPEMTGMLVRDRDELLSKISDEASDPLVAKAAALAKQLSVHLHIGSTAIRLDGEKVANRGFIFAPDGSLIARYDKIHMFDVDLADGESWRESRTYRPGEEAIVARTALGTIGMSVCYDLRFPQLYRAQARAGAEILTVPAAFTRQTGQKHWHTLLRARAIENGAFVIAAAQGGRHEDGRETFGHSLIVAPDGAILADADGDEPCIVIADLDIGAVASQRASIPNLTNEREFSLNIVG
ncbi:carbon-nitrogen hydrolase family protein [Notoacmeibacter sp. MSK16QG-6]|uniref:carbon-nitrogen hydrolase family protein n=1 Tax=Notoacmeibacter sp. MSK16QG-6 TaxID=2957982 RepID=UPI0020A12AD1|nr:carbon-nitrogen hydrolase family protein [Notoacmeibacter sp. MSK16QG-6]MCP1199942.1 carbon-nitrogen hydrolase family protein [Notoacmeibacter sp. MSK16QG-6]